MSPSTGPRARYGRSKSMSGSEERSMIGGTRGGKGRDLYPLTEIGVEEGGWDDGAERESGMEGR